MKAATLLVTALLVALLTACATYSERPLSAADIPCPAKKPIASAGTAAQKRPPMPGEKNLSQGLVLLDQGRYASAYAAFRDAIDQGLPDTAERAQTYRNIGLLMCRLNSAEACQRNLEIAFFTGGPFEMSNRDLQLPYVQSAYSGAKHQYLYRCDREAIQAKAATPSGKEPTQVSLVQVQPPQKTKVRNKNRALNDVVLLLRIAPWARVSIDDTSQIVTPPVKTLHFKPGEKTIAINHPSFEPVIIEAKFKAGQTWMLRQIY